VIVDHVVLLGDRLASYEELETIVASQGQLIVGLTAELEALREQVAELRRRLGLTSSNSSKPPSSDGLAKLPPRSQRRREGRKPGKQKGSAGATLSAVAEPDEVKEHRPASCDRCSAGLSLAEVVGMVRRQVFDLPEIRMRVVEHRVLSCRCTGCGTVSTGRAPQGVNAPVQYGPRLMAVGAYLAVGHHLPMDRVAQILADLLGCPVSSGWVATVPKRTARALKPFTTRLRDAIGRERVVHFDETAARCCGRNRWIHVACTPLLTSYHLDDKRGQAAIDVHAILPNLTAPQVAVHDGWMPYLKTCYADVDHALCNAHHLRELDGWAEHDPVRHAWAATLANLLREGNRLVKQARAAGHDQLEPAVLTDLTTRWNTAIDQAYAANPPPTGKRARGKILALIDRMRGYFSEIWRFAHDFTVAFDNNQAERDIRMIKLQVKISGCWRTIEGARDWLHVREYISTTAKNGINILTALREAITGTPWMPALPE
jgi:transposase